MTIIKGNNMDGSNEIILKDKLDTKEFIIYNYKIKNRQNYFMEQQITTVAAMRQWMGGVAVPGSGNKNIWGCGNSCSAC